MEDKIKHGSTIGLSQKQPKKTVVSHAQSPLNVCLPNVLCLKFWLRPQF